MNNFTPSNFTILIVDDLPKNIQVLGSVLKNQNYKLEFATNGLKALEWLEEKEFDLILLDIMMPEMDGYETCEKIRMIDKYKDTPIVFLTAKTDKDSVVKGFEVGGHDYVTKPFDANELLARVKIHLELKQAKQKLKDVNEWLEAKVEERTLELNNLNQELKKANHSLDQLNKELISLDYEKSEFLKIISHEIRTPLNGLVGILKVIKSDINDEELLKYFEYIDVSSSRLEKFSLQALLITELRTNNRSIEKVEIDIKESIKNIIQQDLHKKSIIKKNLNILFDINPANLKVFADQELYVKSIENIIENAVQFCRPGGNVIIKGYDSNSSTCIEIKDEGPGFSEKALNNLFKLFSPGENHIDMNMGLDLALVQLVMKTHDGSIEVKNRDKNGAIVKLCFPI